MITADALVLCLTWVKTYGQLKSARKLQIKTPLSMLFLRDGTLYFMRVSFVFACDRI